METLKKLNNAEQEPTYLYSSERFNRGMIYLDCCSCGAEIVCCAEDAENFLINIKDMKCPKCGASVMEDFNLSIGVKESIPLIDTVLEHMEKYNQR